MSDYSVIEVSQATFDEIQSKLEKGGRELTAWYELNNTPTLVMDGLALQPLALKGTQIKSPQGL